MSYQCECKVCVAAPRPTSAIRRGLIRMRSLANFSKLWPEKSAVYFRIGSGASDAEVRNIQTTANTLSRLTGLRFIQTARSDADIRIGFNRGAGSWSAIGTDARNFPQNQDTMNFGWDVSEDIVTVLHEFGHAIGLGHEHQNPKGGLNWNEEKVYAALSGPPNNWSREQIKFNVLDYAVLVPGGWTATEFDAYSVMLYRFPNDWLKGQVLPKLYVKSYSSGDKAMMAKMYHVDTRKRCGFWCRIFRRIFHLH